MNDGLVQKDNNLDTRIKILSQEMLICNTEALMIIILLEIMFINNMVKSFSTNKKILSQYIHVKYKNSGIHFWKVITIVEVFNNNKIGKTPRSRSQVKSVGTHGEVMSQEILIWNIKALVLIVEKILARWKFQAELQDKITE